MAKQDEEKNITVNRKARHEYAIIQTFEVGIVLGRNRSKSTAAGKGKSC